MARPKSAASRAASLAATAAGSPGRNVELVPGKRIVQAWRAKNWPSDLYSLVTFTLKKAGRGARLTLDHTGISGGHSGHLSSGWKARYWGPLRAYLATHG